MKKKKDALEGDTKLNESFEAFEEWEQGQAHGTPGQEEETALKEDEILKEIDEDLPGFDDVVLEEEVEPKVTASKSPANTEPVFEMEVEKSFGTELAPDVPVALVAVIGKTTATVSDLIKYQVGRVVDLGRPPGETVDLVANGKLIARGELVEMDGKLGVRILKMVR